MAVARRVWAAFTGNGVGQYEIPQGAVMKIRNPKFETRTKFEIRNFSNLFSKFARKFAAQADRFDLKAVGFKLPVYSIFEFRISDLFRISSFELRICS